MPELSPADPHARGASQAIDWLVLAEDWGRHPSTAQHLVAHLPASDRVLWVDSLGMRAPRAAVGDLQRVLGRVRRLGDRTAPAPTSGRAPDAIVRPLFLPWHGQPACRALNRRLIGRAVARALARLGMRRPALLTANPVVAHYLDALPASLVAYLRLDDYASLPGVDPRLVAASEPALIARAHLVVAPSARLLPAGARRTLILPQGVDSERFAAVPLEPPAGRVIGYWGSIAAWLDLDLVERVARGAPDWTFELRGPADPSVASVLRRLPNVRLLEPVPHDGLARAAAHWRGAWAPFSEGRHLAHASPLKLREYLAAGFPVACTPIPEARELGGVTLVASAEDVLAWIAGEVASDSSARRSVRRESQAGVSWTARARTLRDRVSEALAR